MDTPEVRSHNPEELTKKGRKQKFLAILLIAISIVSLVMTPKTLPWFIFLEGAIGIAGVVLFVYARLKFWREIKKSLQ